MAVPRGVEPPTFGLGNRCSIFFAVQPRSDPGLTFYFQDTFRFFMTCISDGSLETGQHGGGGLSIYPGGVRPYFKRSKFFWHRCPVLPSCFHRLSLWKQKILLKEIRESLQMVAGAPEEIRTPDPQIRSLVLYPAELRALEPLAKTGPRQHGIAIDLVTYWQGLPLAALPAPARRASCRDARMWRAACTNNSLALSTHTLVRSAKSRAQYPRPPASRACPRAPACDRKHVFGTIPTPFAYMRTTSLCEEHRRFQALPLQALARSPRRGLRSTALSGIVMLKVAPIVPGTSRISPPCARTNSAAMARPSPVPPVRAAP